ncbi:phytohormone-binding protein-like [Cucumis melo var. makuwa]|uniref:Phytohormone-binding protein-like n=1 Tax=Cucumis melo var. makuwa TaxID=1194695 RepID=A0A5A7U045_CUCMM|nr:phytohormone-binding protein-like [Cucumis melo var. makuwa]TYK03287.1 phytohormone-binding protein-like [Cucumis melo var. makuwa]
MVKEAKAQAKVRVGIETLWKALVKDLRFIIPKLMPNTVEKIELIHGNGGLGSVFLFHLGRVKIVKIQKERIVELDETKHEFGLEVMEGILLKRGFSSFKTTFKLSSMKEKETLVDVKVVYGTERDDEDEVHMEEVATKPALSFLQLLEKFLIDSSS